MSRILFVTHPEVVIDPHVPVPEWPLSEIGRGRMEAFAERLAGEPVAAVWSSAERKARDGAEILSQRLGLTPQVDEALHENDRSSTGYIPPPRFWAVVAEFFAKPHESILGWERAIDAQDRIAAAVQRVAATQTGTILIVSHGGVGALLTARLQNVTIGQEDRPAHPGGGCVLTLSREPMAIAQSWRNIEDW